MTRPSAAPSLDLATLRQGYESGRFSVAEIAGIVLARIGAAGEDAVWIGRPAADAVMARAAALEARQRAAGTAGMPLFGVPFAVKDNIDVAGLDTTAGCPAFAYRAETTATAVAKLEAAGALLIGKTNLDQFATGLVGVRSPYGVSRNPFDPAYIPGGSSSGSAVAVAAGLVSFALGTDTAGSGRVPAGFNNIVGLKPTRGLVSAAGVVPACRSLDCVSIFALTPGDAMAVLAAAQGPDPADPFSRVSPPGFRAALAAPPPLLRFGVPRPADLRFFGDGEAERLFAAAVARLARLGGTAVDIDFTPFAEAAALLYGGPWLAERTAAVGRFLDERPEAVLPVTREIIGAGRRFSAVDAFQAQYRLAELAARTASLWRDIDFLVLPTAGTIYRIDEIAADPIGLNSNLGYYTNFVNLLDLAAIAVPGGFDRRGLPQGVTLVAPAWHDAVIAGAAEAFHRASDLPLGATGHGMPPAAAPPAGASAFPAIAVAVFGAHLSGEPLNAELRDLGARLRRACRTSATYRLYALPDGKRPGLLRRAGDGVAIETEIWDIPAAAFAAFMAGIAPPLAIGTVELDDGSRVKGFLCEPEGLAGAQDISAFGGWRGYRRAAAARG